MAQPKLSTAEGVLNAFYDAERLYMNTQSAEHQKAMLSYFSPNIILYQTPALPYGGEYKGIARFQEWGQQMSEYFDTVDVQNPRIFSREGSDRVMVMSTLHLRVRKSGQDLEYPLVQSISVDLEKGLITEIRPFYWDVAGLNAALGV